MRALTACCMYASLFHFQRAMPPGYPMNGPMDTSVECIQGPPDGGLLRCLMGLAAGHSIGEPGTAGAGVNHAQRAALPV